MAEYDDRDDRRHPDLQKNQPQKDPGFPYGEFDARVWAKEFCRIYPDTAPDEDVMLGWFSNAIMTGYDRAMRSIDPNV